MTEASPAEDVPFTRLECADGVVIETCAVMRPTTGYGAAGVAKLLDPRLAPQWFLVIKVTFPKGHWALESRHYLRANDWFYETDGCSERRHLVAHWEWQGVTADGRIRIDLCSGSVRRAPTKTWEVDMPRRVFLGPDSRCAVCDGAAGLNYVGGCGHALHAKCLGPLCRCGFPLEYAAVSSTS